MTPLEATRRAEAAASTRRSPLIWTLALGALLVAVAGVSVFGWLPTSEAVRGIVLREIRVPRVLAATVAGFALAVAGVLVQGALRNRLAVPDLFGVSGGAALATAVVVTHNLIAPPWHPLVAFGGALAGGGICLAAARRAHTPTQALLVGSAVSIGLQGAVLSVMATADQIQLAYIYRYLVGSLTAVTREALAPMLWPVLLGLALAVLVTPVLGILSLGDQAAAGLGLDPRTWRIVILGVAAVLVAVVVAPLGPLAWVSLIGPTLSRWSWPHLDERVRPLHAGLVGATLTVAADLAARQVFTPFETPVGAWTSFVGFAVAAVLLRRRRPDGEHPAGVVAR